MNLKNRLNKVIEKDKRTNPKYIIDVLKSDFYYLINNFFEVDFEDIEIDIELNKDKYEINLKCFGDRIKAVKTLPNV